MLAQFSPQDLLASKSPETVIYHCIDITLRLAVLGYISQSIEIINLASQIGHFDLRLLHSTGLYFAWEAVEFWPALVPEAHRQVSWLKELDEGATLSKWTESSGPRPPGQFEALEMNEIGLGRLLDVVEEREGTGGMLHYTKNGEIERILRPGAACMVLDFSLRLGGHDDDVQNHLSTIAELKDFKGIAKSRSAWQILKDGYMSEKWTDGEDMTAQFDRLRGILVERVENGVQRPFKNMTMRELLERLDRNTIKHDNDEDQDSLELEQLQKYLFMGNRSILHPPASAMEIECLEQKLGVQLPEDYKGFLSVSNGLEGIWNGVFRQRDLGSTEMVHNSKLIWRGRGIALELVDWQELPIKIEWPPLDLTQAISIDDPKDESNAWLLKPQLIKTAVDKFFETYDALDEEKKIQTEKVIRAYYGSLEELRAMGWCVATWTHWGIQLEVWKSFREFVEALVLASEIEV